MKEAIDQAKTQDVKISNVTATDKGEAALHKLEEVCSSRRRVIL